MLLSSAPKLKYSSAEASKATPDRPIAGDMPSVTDIPAGCPFHPRCPKRFEPCDKLSPDLKVCGESTVACHLY
jgi:oligopeptide/dipeptide ABC transporter ATP-binding protein